MKKITQKLYQLIKQHLTILKIIFMFSVLCFVIFELGRILKEVNGQVVKAELAQQGLGHLIIMTIVGLVAVVPMLNYDIVINELLPGDYPLAYQLKSGWIVNTFTNLAGFGGFLGASLRAHFYHKNASQKQILFAISKIALFLLAGLSIWSFIGLIFIFGFKLGWVYHHYAVWLVGGALYFPILFGIAHFKNTQYFADLTLNRTLRLTISSFLEWGFAAGCFMIIGKILDLNLNLLQVLPLFMIANIIGVISMVPGGLGSFDVLMILGLSQLGVKNELAVLWLLFYRIFYYMIPFIIGVIAFLHDTSLRFNESLEGLPVQIMRKVAHGFMVFFLYLSGVLLLLVATVPNFAISNSVVGRLYPYTFYFIDRVTNIIVAFIMLGLARGVANRVKKVYYPLIGLLVIAIANTLWRDFSLKLAVFLSLILIASLFLKKELYRHKLTLSWNDLIMDGGIFTGTFLIYSVVGFMNSPRIHHRRPVPNALLFPSEKIWLAGFVGLLVAFVTLVIVYHYLSQTKVTLKSVYNPKRLQAIIDEFGGNEVSQLAFLGDKQLYVYQVDDHDQVFLMFQQRADRLVVMGEPVGNPRYLLAAIEQFVQEADLLDCSAVFYEISADLTMQLHEIGFDFIKFGEEGFVDLPTFSLTGNKKRAQRALMNKFQREGYQFDVLQPPYSNAQLATLKNISDQWLDGRVEKGFSLGFFEVDYLQKAPIAVVYDTNQEIIAFANLMPMGSKKQISIDLMRYLPSAPSGIMDLIFINLFQHLQPLGYTSFDLGMAPLANVGTSKFSFIEERIANLIYNYGYRFYGFKGLRSYKQKFTSTWQSKYIAYRKRSSLVFTMLQILLIVNQKANFKQKKPNAMFALKK